MARAPAKQPANFSGGATAFLALEIHDLARALHIPQGPMRGRCLPRVEPPGFDALCQRPALRGALSCRGSTRRATVVYGVGRLTEAFSMGVSASLTKGCS